MTNRKAGWYWVRNGLGWELLRWSGCVWDGHLNDADLEEVGQRIPEPDEPWQCVPVEPTKEMKQRALRYNDFESGGTSVDDFNSDIYLAMLSAAPKPEDAR